MHFAATPARVELVTDRSHLVADGSTRPVVAIRVLDRTGRPVHAGISGPITLSAPYESAQALDALQNRVLAGLDRTPPTWIVKGDDGIALVELAPTLVSGGLDLSFQFTDREVKRQQVLETWVVPGESKWTLVGLAEGAVGVKTIADHMQRTGRFDSDLGDHGARGVSMPRAGSRAKYLTTIAYDSAKQRAEQRLLGGLDSAGLLHRLRRWHGPPVRCGQRQQALCPHRERQSARDVRRFRHPRSTRPSLAATSAQ